MATAALTDTPDPTFDRYARMVREDLDVPLALVSLVEADRQIFPGASGLPPAIDDVRSTPLTHSFCQYVVKDAAALIIDDARRDERLRDNPAIQDLAAVAYAGFPLTDTAGHIVGALCAIDHRRHHWTESELRRLDDLAHLCSREIVLHELTHRNETAESEALVLSRRSRVLLELSELLSDTLSMGDVGSAVARAAVAGLGATHAGIWHRADPNDRSLRFIAASQAVWARAENHAPVPIDGDHPVAVVHRTGRPLVFADHEAFAAAHPGSAPFPRPVDQDACAIVPLVAAGEIVGCLAMTWADARVLSDDDRDTVAALSVYTAQAVQRASLLDERMGAATTMQRALLTELPRPEGLELGARYRTAAVNDQVGGDWYDATVLADGGTTLMIGDVTGHDIRAAAAMGQLRSMLRALAWAIDDAPSVNVSRLDRAARDLHVPTLASLVYARLAPAAADGHRLLRWTNAGHLPPLLVTPDGHSRVLDDGAGADCLLGVCVERARRDQEAVLSPGDTVLFFTDGLVERRGEDLAAGLQRLRDALERYHGRSVEELLDAVLAEVPGRDRGDDVALLAVRLH